MKASVLYDTQIGEDSDNRRINDEKNILRTVSELSRAFALSL